MCGITALLINTQTNHSNLTQFLRQSILQLQHRGYDGAGISLPSNNEQIVIRKGQGLIKNVLTDSVLEDLLSEAGIPPSYGIAHTRYKTKGECSNGASQPLLSENNKLCLVHNGQVETKKYLPDSIYILNLIERRINSDPNPEPNQIFDTIQHIFKTLKGSYSCVLMIQDFGLVVFRDPHGIRPLIYATNQEGDFGVASEDIALRNLPIFQSNTNYNNLLAGECLIIQPNQPILKRNLLDGPAFNLPCIFEYIYLAHPDSILNDISVHKAREVLGELLAEEIKNRVTEHIDYVISIPETSCIATKILSQKIDTPYLSFLKLRKNREKARTFILPTQEERIKAVSNKFEIDETLKDKIKDKTILIVDDSIVRGTTLGYVVQYIRESCHPAKIILSSISPPVRFKNIYGIDIPDTEDLIASKYKNHLDIAKALNADQVIYQDYSNMMRRFKEWGMQLEPPISNFESSLFSGTYIY